MKSRAYNCAVITTSSPMNTPTIRTGHTAMIEELNRWIPLYRKEDAELRSIGTQKTLGAAIVYEDCAVALEKLILKHS